MPYLQSSVGHKLPSASYVPPGALQQRNLVHLPSRSEMQRRSRVFLYVSDAAGEARIVDSSVL